MASLRIWLRRTGPRWRRSAQERKLLGGSKAKASCLTTRGARSMNRDLFGEKDMRLPGSKIPSSFFFCTLKVPGYCGCQMDARSKLVTLEPTGQRIEASAD